MKWRYGDGAPLFLIRSPPGGHCYVRLTSPGLHSKHVGPNKYSQEKRTHEKKGVVTHMWWGIGLRWVEVGGWGGGLCSLYYLTCSHVWAA